MKVAQLILDGASAYERKAQRIDAAALAGAGHETFVVAPGAAFEADIAHVYGPHVLPGKFFVGMRVPYVAPADVVRSRFGFRRPVPPAAIVSPLAAEGVSLLPEAVDERYFAKMSRVEGDVRVLGTFAGERKDVQSMVDRTRIRLERTRPDIRWEVFGTEPSPEEIGSVDAWVDPAVDPLDFDGYVAEASASNVVVVAARTPVNVLRLEQGRTGFLVPPNDPNETAHAILAALFKTEAAQQKLQAASQTIAKFRARQRLRALLRIYETILGGSIRRDPKRP